MPSKVSDMWKHIQYVTLGIMCPQQHLSIWIYIPMPRRMADILKAKGWATIYWL